MSPQGLLENTIVYTTCIQQFPVALLVRHGLQEEASWKKFKTFNKIYEACPLPP